MRAVQIGSYLFPVMTFWEWQISEHDAERSARQEMDALELGERAAREL